MGEEVFFVGLVFLDNFDVNFCIKFIFLGVWVIGVENVFFKVGFLVFMFIVLKFWGGGV